MTTVTIQVTNNAATAIKNAINDTQDLQTVLCNAFAELANDDIISDPDEFHRHNNIRCALFEFSRLLNGLNS